MTAASTIGLVIGFFIVWSIGLATGYGSLKHRVDRATELLGYWLEDCGDFVPGRFVKAQTERFLGVASGESEK